MTEAENQIRGAYESAVQRLKDTRATIESLREQERQIYLRIKDCEAAGRLFGIEFPSIDKPGEPLDGTGNVRSFTVSFLQNSPSGAKSQEIGAAYEEQFRHKLHPKTIGMTLYRLKKDNLAMRDGRVWRIGAYQHS